MGHEGRILEEQFDSWNKLGERLLHLDQTTPLIYRGQRHDWPLIPKLERLLDPTKRYEWPEMENAYFRHFQERARVHLEDPPGPSDLLGWWSLMQHYGAPTRLLDWTASPFVALFFALEAPPLPGTKQDPVLWCLHPGMARSISGGPVGTLEVDRLGIRRIGVPGTPVPKVDWYELELERLRWAIEHRWPLPYPVIPERLDARMIAQQTVLTCDSRLDGGAMDFDDLPDEMFDPRPGSRPALMLKISFPEDIRRECLVSLQRMGITAEALFPSLDGVGRGVQLRASADLPASVRDVFEGRGPWARP